jgi:hypothetical protein
MLFPVMHMINTVFAYIAFSLLFRVHLTGHRTFIGNAKAPFLLYKEYCLVGESFESGSVSQHLCSRRLPAGDNGYICRECVRVRLWL